MPNAGKTEHLRFTAVWMKQAGKWQEVARHANIVPEQSTGPAVEVELCGRLILDNFVWQIGRCRSFREMRSQNATDIADCVYQSIGEALIPKMIAHQIDNTLPVLLAATLVNSFVADDGELMRTRRHEYEDGIAFWRFAHS